MRVEAKDIPVMQKFMTELWKTIKEFYQVEETEEYSAAVTRRLEDLYEIYPDPLAKELVMALFRYIDHKQREMRNEQIREGAEP